MRPQGMGKTYTEPTIDNINLPAEIDRVSAKYKGAYAKKLTSADRQILNETNIHPFCF